MNEKIFELSTELKEANAKLDCYELKENFNKNESGNLLEISEIKIDKISKEKKLLEEKINQLIDIIRQYSNELNDSSIKIKNLNDDIFFLQNENRKLIDEKNMNKKSMNDFNNNINKYNQILTENNNNKSIIENLNKELYEYKMDISKDKNFCLDLNKEKCEEKINLNLKEYVSDSNKNLTKVINKKRKKVGDLSLELEVNEGIEPKEDEKLMQINKSLAIEKDWQKIILGKIMEKQEKKMKELEQKLNEQWNVKLEVMKNELQEEYSKVLDRSAFSEVEKFTSKEDFERKLVNWKDGKEKGKLEDVMKRKEGKKYIDLTEAPRKFDSKEVIELLRKEMDMKIGEVYSVLKDNYVSKSEEKDNWSKSIMKNDDSRTTELILDDLEKNGGETFKKSIEEVNRVRKNKTNDEQMYLKLKNGNENKDNEINNLKRR